MGSTIIEIYLSIIRNLCELVFVLFCCYVLCLVTNSAFNISASINSIFLLNGINFKSWQENVRIVLRVIDLDLVLRVAQPADLLMKVPLMKKGK